MSATTPAQAAALASGRGNPRLASILLGILPPLAVTIFAFGVALGVRGDHVPMLALALTTGALCLVPLCLDMARPPERRHLLLSILALVFLSHFVLPVFTHYLLVEGPTDAASTSNTNLFPRHVVRGQWVALLGLLSLLAGYATLPLRVSPARERQRLLHDWPPQVTVLIGLLMLPFGWSIVVAGYLGLLGALGTGFIGALASSINYGYVLLTIAALRYRSRLAVFVLVTTLPLATALGFLTGSKRRTLVFLATVVLTAMLVRARIRARWLLAGLAVLMLLYPLSQFYREVILDDNRRTVVDVLRNPAPALEAVSDYLGGSRSSSYVLEGVMATGSRLDGLGIESVIVRDTPAVSPFQKGRTLGLFFLAFVPRAFWPDKPEITIGRWITAVYGSGPHIESSTGPTFLGEFYLNFGTLGVVGGMLLYGILLRLFQASFLGPNATTPGILAATVVVVQVLTKLMGTFSQTLSATAFALAPILATHFLVVFLTGRPSARVPAAPEAPLGDPSRG